MKKICIIGSGSGIGKALSMYYQKNDYICDEYTRADYDLSKVFEIQKFSYDIASRQYDIVIFAAGVGYYGDFYNMQSDKIGEQIQVNTHAPISIVHALGNNTKFIYLSSVMQYISPKNMSVYAATKRATSQVLETLSSDNTLSIDLGAVKTPMHIKAGMGKMVGREVENIIPKLVKSIEKKSGRTTLFWDWWVMIYIIFPLIRILSIIKK